LEAQSYGILYSEASRAMLPGPTRQELASTTAESTSSFQSCLRSFSLCSTSDSRFYTFTYIHSQQPPTCFSLYRVTP